MVSTTRALLLLLASSCFACVIGARCEALGGAAEHPHGREFARPPRCSAAGRGPRRGPRLGGRGTPTAGREPASRLHSLFDADNEFNHGTC